VFGVRLRRLGTGSAVAKDHDADSDLSKAALAGIDYDGSRSVRAETPRLPCDPPAARPRAC